MNKKTILHIGIVIIIAILGYFLVIKILQNNTEKQITKIQVIKKDIINRVDSIKYINNYIDTLNKKDGVQVKQIKQNIIKNDSIIDNSSINELSKLLYKHTM